MDVKIVEEKESPLLKRKDLRLEIVHESAPTPSKVELAKQLAEKYKVDESQVAIGYMFMAKGACKTKAKVKILKEKPKESKESKASEKTAEKAPEKTAEEKPASAKENVAKDEKSETGGSG
jgi:small subunit ribosomal protein S24e